MIKNGAEKYYFQLNSESELLRVFRTKDQKKIVLPKKLAFPLKAQHYFTWSDPHGLYVYLVFKDPKWEAPKGIVFRSDDKGSIRSTVRLCDWCHAFGPSDQIGMLTMKPNARTTVGMLLCLDLSCIHKIESLTGITKKSFEKLADQVCERISFFFENNFSNSEKMIDDKIE